MTPIVVAALTFAAVMIMATPALSACMSAEHEESAQGRLVSGRFKDAADRPETAFILQLATPVCLQGSDEFDKVETAKTIHVFSSKDDMSRKIRSFVGKFVRVRGTPFGVHTAHHHAPIVMNVSDIQPR